jgi:arylesterase / paraoxonase
MSQRAEGTMRWYWRVLATVCGILVVGIVFVVVRTLNAGGVFADVTSHFDGTCKAIAGVIGAEDMQVDRKARLLFISATDRRALMAGKPDPQDGLYMLALGNPGAAPVKLSGTPKDFHPHGLSLYRDARGRETLMVVNHQSDGTQAVEIFDVNIGPDGVALNYRAHVTGDLLFSPNDLVAVSGDAFYATNDHGSRTKFGAMLENWLLLPRANVVYYDGDVFKVAADGLRFANGINVSPDGKFIYVAESTGREIDTYARNSFDGNLTLKNTFDIPSGLDNIDVDARGNLWAASHPKLLDLIAYAKNPSKPSPSEVTELRVSGGIPESARTVYENAGDEIGASSVGVVDGKHLYIGSIFDPKILDCEMK